MISIDLMCCEYIENTGLAYIKTDYIPQQGDILTVDFELSTVTGNPVFVGCANASSGTTNRFVVGQQGSSEGYHYQSADKNWINSSVVADTNRHTLVFDTTNGKLMLDGNVVKTFTPSFGTLNYPIGIFAKYYGTNNLTDNSAATKGKIYNVTIENNGVVKLNCIPCYNENSIGMLDTVSCKFYTNNNNTGAFLKGPDIEGEFPETNASLKELTKQYSSLFTDIADSIREKTGSEDRIPALEFPEAIANIESGTTYPDYFNSQKNTYWFKYNESEGLRNNRMMYTAYVSSVSNFTTRMFSSCTNLQYIELPNYKSDSLNTGKSLWYNTGASSLCGVILGSKENPVNRDNYYESIGDITLIDLLLELGFSFPSGILIYLDSSNPNYLTTMDELADLVDPDMMYYYACIDGTYYVLVSDYTWVECDEEEVFDLIKDPPIDASTFSLNEEEEVDDDEYEE